MNVLLKSGNQGDVNQRLGNGARAGRGVESIVLFTDFIRDDQGVLADGAETIRHFL